MSKSFSIQGGKKEGGSIGGLVQKLKSGLKHG